MSHLAWSNEQECNQAILEGDVRQTDQMSLGRPMGGTEALKSQELKAALSER